MRQHLGWNTESRVDHHDLDTGLDALQDHLDPPAFRRELDRVHQQVPDDLLKTVRVALDRTRCGVQDCLQPDSLGLGGRADGIERGLQDSLEIDGAEFEAHLPSDDARDIEEVVDEPDWACALRMIASMARVVVSASSWPVPSILAHPYTALSGVRSSCERTVRNSSFARLAASAWPRACSASP